MSVKADSSAKILQKYFKVTVTTIWRDPVRRSYSQISNWYKHLTDNDNAPDVWKVRDPDKLLRWEKIKDS